MLRTSMLSLLLIVPAVCLRAEEETKKSGDPSSPKAAWRRLFDGETLSKWKPTNFGGEGEVTVEEGNLILDYGSPLTGVTYTRDFPKTNYEVRLEAMRVDGRDFFVGMTFPVDDSFCSWIVGGWGGAVVGLSSIDGKDASENDTTKFLRFENGKWYRFRLRVTPERIQAWIDDELQIDQSIVGKKISTRSEVVLSKPFGLATFETKSALRNIEVRELNETERVKK